MNTLQSLLNSFVDDPENSYINFELGKYYHSIGQTSSAVSYYIRTAERTEDKKLAYTCLLACSLCFETQGTRSNSVKGMLQTAVSICPKRPEGYYLLSKFYEQSENYHDSYLIASIGEKVANHQSTGLEIDVGYPGEYGILFEKAVSSWHCGLTDESCQLHYELKYKWDMWDIHKNAIDNNIEKLFKEKIENLHKEESCRTVPIIENKSIRNTENISPISWIVDDFYSDPDEIRNFALRQEYDIGGIGRGYIGNRTHNQFLFDDLKERFENIMGKKIIKWEEYGMNGRFQYCWSGQPVVYHCDSQMWGGMIYLTPNAPFECGTTLYANKENKVRRGCEPGGRIAWDGKEGDPFLDKTPFEPVDVLGNVYNRLVIFDAQCIHSASEYFGTVKENCRLWQMFFFDTE